MEVKEFTTTILTATDGNFLTQSDNDIELINRIVCTQIALGKNDKASNYKEISAAEAEELKEQIQKQKQALITAK